MNREGKSRGREYSSESSPLPHSVRMGRGANADGKQLRGGDSDMVTDLKSIDISSIFEIRGSRLKPHAYENEL